MSSCDKKKSAPRWNHRLDYWSSSLKNNIISDNLYILFSFIGKNQFFNFVFFFLSIKETENYPHRLHPVFILTFIIPTFHGNIGAFATQSVRALAQGHDPGVPHQYDHFEL